MLIFLFLIFYTVVIDAFSKYAWALPIKTKTSSDIIGAFKKIFSLTDRRPLRIQTDKGREFNNHKFINFLKQHDVAYNTIANPVIKCSLAERFIRTLRRRLYMYFYANKTIKYIDVLSKIINAYNNTTHSSTKYKPALVNATNILSVYKNLMQKHKLSKCKNPKFQKDDTVRISKYKKTFEKSYMTNFSEEIFKIKQVIHHRPNILYRLCDLNGENIDGTFYENEIQKVIIDENTAFTIDKIIKQKRVGRSLKLFVKWRGYPKQFNSWIDAKFILK